MEKLYGGIEAGGTKFNCIVAANPDEIVVEETIPTTSPAETINRVLDVFRPHQGSLAAIGVGSFGPLDLNPASKTYGYITTTPKPGWQFTDLCGHIRTALGAPIAFDTDVNAAAVGERVWIQQNNVLDPFIYITVGTGIGVGVIVNGKPIHGLVHPEAGHMSLPHDLQEDPFAGNCPYHRDCWEGLASGPAMAKRWGMLAEELPDDHPAWALEANYIAHAIANLVYAFSPQRIVLGGGVGKRTGLLELVQQRCLAVLNNYIRSEIILEHIEDYIVAPGLGSRSGSLGAIAMAQNLGG
ncbi:MAG: ROK family protein [Anaerolineae bacterium]|nr:ROK family protein [Anaerolineae bacterium]